MKEIKKYVFRKELKLEFEILDLKEILESKRNMMVIPHRAQFYHILWIDKGKGVHYVDFNPIEITDSCLIFIPQNSVNVFDPHGEYEGKVILFTDSFFCKNQEDHKFLLTGILFSDLYETAKLDLNSSADSLRSGLATMEKEYKNHEDPSRALILHNMLHVFVLFAERQLRQQGFKELQASNSLNILMEFKSLLEQNFKFEKSVKNYAQELNLSEKQLSKATKDNLDKRPKQLIDERIILEIKRLLVHTQLHVKEIAYDMGYDEPTNFVKYFRKHTGLTPLEFRAIHQ